MQQANYMCSYEMVFNLWGSNYSGTSTGYYWAQEKFITITSSVSDSCITVQLQRLKKEINCWFRPFSYFGKVTVQQFAFSDSSIFTFSCKSLTIRCFPWDIFCAERPRQSLPPWGVAVAHLLQILSRSCLIKSIELSY